MMSPVLSDNCIYYTRLRAEGMISTDDYILFFVPLCPTSAPPLPFFLLWLCEKRKKTWWGKQLASQQAGYHAAEKKHQTLKALNTCFVNQAHKCERWAPMWTRQRLLLLLISASERSVFVFVSELFSLVCSGRENGNVILHDTNQWTVTSALTEDVFQMHRLFSSM